jgi:hypothetical protein
MDRGRLGIFEAEDAHARTTFFDYLGSPEIVAYPESVDERKFLKCRMEAGPQ